MVSSREYSPLELAQFAAGDGQVAPAPDARRPPKFHLMVGAAALTLGGLGLGSFLLIRDPQLLWAPMIGVGIAWASILSAPYAILSSAAPAGKMGVYMGIFNIFIVAPQVLAATLLGLALRAFFGGAPIYALLIGAASLIAAALAALAIPDRNDLSPGMAMKREAELSYALGTRAVDDGRPG